MPRSEADRLAAAVAQGHEDAVQAWPQEGRDRQRRIDSTPCPKCGGDRLRADFTGSGRCHAGTPAPVSSPAGEDVDAAARLAHARLMWAHKVNGFGTPWEALTESQRNGWREFVRDITAAASLLRQDPPQVAEEDVDAAARLAHARLMWAHKVNGFGTPWEELTEGQRDGWREFVRDVAQAATPTAGEDVERVARAIRDAYIETTCLGEPGTAGSVEDWHTEARAALAALSARPVQAQGTDDGEVERLRAEAGDIMVGFTADAIRLTRERDAALARAEAAEAEVERHALANGGCVPADAYRDLSERAEALRAVVEAVRGLDFDLLDWAIDEIGHTVYEATETEPAECTDECPACAVAEFATSLRAALAPSVPTEGGRDRG